jgi:hypothetical protein
MSGTAALRPIRPHAGAASDPADFVGRTTTTHQARLDLLRGCNLALTDPRRMGKTYWIGYFCSCTTDFVPVRIDFEGVTSSDMFLTLTAGALGRHHGIPQKAKQVLRALFDGLEVAVGPVKVRPAISSLTPPRLLRDTVMAVNDSAAGKPVLVCMDEVPTAIRNITENEGELEARAVLQALRALRADATNIRWIISGSVGFHHVLRHCGATEGEINDLVNLPLGPLKVDEAEELVARLLLGITRTASLGGVAELVGCTGGIPFLIHGMANLLDTGGREEITSELVRRAFDSFVRDRDASRPFTHLVSRIERYYDDRQLAAFRILDAVATSESPILFADLESLAQLPHEDALETMNWLVDDHYLAESVDGFAWRYDVLRTIWTYRRRLGA